MTTSAAALEFASQAQRGVRSGLGDFDWASASTIIAGLIAGAFVLLGLLAASARARLDTRRAVYAEAICAVSEYLEGPYRVARCRNDANERFALSKDLSDIQSRIDAHLVLVELHARDDVSRAYAEYVQVARSEAGQQMAAAWNKKAPRRQAAMNRIERFDRTESNKAKKGLLAKMAKDVKPGWRLYKYTV